MPRRKCGRAQPVFGGLLMRRLDDWWHPIDTTHRRVCRRRAGAITTDSFGARERLTVDGAAYAIYRLDRVAGSDLLPYSLKVQLENLLRNKDGRLVTAEQASALANWDPVATQGSEIQFMPARVLLQDFTGVSCVVAASIEVPRRLLGDDLSEGVRSKLLNR